MSYRFLVRAAACGLLATGALASWAVQAQPTSAPSATQLRNWAAACSGCHGTGGRPVGAGLPLAGRDMADLRERLQGYRSGSLAGTLMPQIAKGYTPEQLDALAGWFAAQKP